MDKMDFGEIFKRQFQDLNEISDLEMAFLYLNLFKTTELLRPLGEKYALVVNDLTTRMLDCKEWYYCRTGINLIRKNEAQIERHIKNLQKKK